MTTNSGIPLLGDVSWGSHFGNFYTSNEELLELLCDYFSAGLRNHEFCLWILSPSLSRGQALQLLKDKVPELDFYIEKEQFMVIDNDAWFFLPVPLMWSVPSGIGRNTVKRRSAMDSTDCV